MTATHGFGSENQAVSEEAMEGAKRFLWPFAHADRSEASEDAQETSETATDHLWEPLKPSRAQRAFQAVLVVGVAGVLAANVWSLAHPRSVVTGPQSMVLPETVGVDVAGASAVAEEAAWAFLNLDDPTVREARLETVWSVPTSSWDGKGSITVDPARVYTVKTTVKDASSVDVLVTVRVDAEGAEGAEGPWVGVLVPVTASAAGASVAGAPTIVGLPDPVEVTALATPDMYSELTATTKADVDAFFKAWADGDVSPLTTPGSHPSHAAPAHRSVVNTSPTAATKDSNGPCSSPPSHPYVQIPSLRPTTTGKSPKASATTKPSSLPPTDASSPSTP